MTCYNPKIHHRRSIRLKGYDYSRPGRYYVTLMTENRKCQFGHVEKGIVQLSKFGKIVSEEWERTPILRPNVSLDEFIIMPNHIHGIIIIKEFATGVLQYAPTKIIHTDQKLKSPSQTLGAIIRGFKASTTKRINQMRETSGKKLWQRDFYEHIIRNDQDYSRICQYIKDNPKNW